MIPGEKYLEKFLRIKAVGYLLKLENIMMNFIVYLTAGLIILSKFFDCYTTSVRISSAGQERNPIARKLMKRFGIQTVIWAIFVLTILIVFLTLWILFSYYNDLIYKLLFVFAGLFISIIQFAVAYTNKTGRLNTITRFLLRRYSK